MMISAAAVCLLSFVFVFAGGTSASAYESFTAEVPVSCFFDADNITGAYTIAIEAVTSITPEPVPGELIISDSGYDSFGLVISEPGTFIYRVYEVEGDDPGVDYDRRVYTLTLFVENDDDGGLRYAITAALEGSDDKVEQVDFRNKVLPDEVVTTTTSTTITTTAPETIVTTVQTTLPAVTTAPVTTKPAETNLITVLIDGVLTGDSFPARALRFTMAAAALTAVAALLFKRKNDEEEGDDE